jgi:hypothetical protein
MEESSIYRGKNLIGKNVLLRVTENSSCRNSSYGRNITCKRYEFLPITWIHFELWKIRVIDVWVIEVQLCIYIYIYIYIYHKRICHGLNKWMSCYSQCLDPEFSLGTDNLLCQSRNFQFMKIHHHHLESHYWILFLTMSAVRWDGRWSGFPPLTCGWKVKGVFWTYPFKITWEGNKKLGK